jgi:hypothetical protein
MVLLPEDGGRHPKHVGEHNVSLYIHIFCANCWFYNINDLICP